MVRQLSPAVAAARVFAIEAHGDQKYGDDPYVVHLDQVAAIVAPHGEFCEVLAYLHDVMENTSRTYANIATAFDDFTADCVVLLSDPDGRNRAEKKKRLHARLAAINAEYYAVLIAKAGDRLANVRRSFAFESEKMIAMYREEHPDFRRAAYRTSLCDEIWLDIERLLDV